MAKNSFAPVTPGEILKEEFLAEYGLSQLEVSLGPADAVTAADRQLLARQTIHAAARAHWLRVSFAPVVTLDGRPTKVAVFVMTLPYSDAIFACTFPRECTESFLEGHVRAFEFFGGVPRRISYDNSRIAGARITGTRDRSKLRTWFSALIGTHSGQVFARSV